VRGLMLVLAQLLPPVQTEQIEITVINMISCKNNKNKEVTKMVENRAGKALNCET